MDHPILYTPAEAAHLLGVGKTTLFALIARGELRSLKLGHSRRIRHADLEAFVAGLTA